MIPFLILYALGAAVTRSYVVNDPATGELSEFDKRWAINLFTALWPLLAVFTVVFRIAKGTWKL